MELMKRLSLRIITLMLVFSLSATGVPAFALDNEVVNTVEENSIQSVEDDKVQNSLEKDSEQNLSEDSQESSLSEDNQERSLPEDVQDSNMPSDEVISDSNNSEVDGDVTPEENNTNIAAPAFHASSFAYGTRITVSADEGVFPKGAELKVEEVSNTGKENKDYNIVSSYTFDIKVVDADGKEIQPKDGDNVYVSFANDKVANNNLTTHVYHSSEELDVNKSGATATVATDGFSFYTVEFTYDDKEYVLKGDSAVKLQTVMDAVGLSGEVGSYEVSDDSLFNIYEEDGILYVAALKAFSTEEWMELTIDGISYHIVVTDDNYINYTGTYNVEGVTQGNTDTDFTKGLGSVNIIIDTDVINTSAESRNNSIPSLLSNFSEFELYNPTKYAGNNKVYLSLNVDKAEKNGRKLNISKDTINKYDGDIIQYTFEDGAYNKNDNSKKYDVVITYSNLGITFSQPNNPLVEGLMLGLFAGNMIGIGGSKKDDKTNKPMNVEQAYGLIVDVNIKVIDKTTKQIVPGSYYFPMVDLDVSRDYTNAYHDDYVKNYNEQVELKTGSYIGDLFIPGGNYTGRPVDPVTNMPYISKIEKTSIGHKIFADKSYNDVFTNDGIPTSSRNNDYYSGFVTIADNTTGGIKLTYRGASAQLSGANHGNGVDTYFLSGAFPLTKYTETYEYENSDQLPNEVKATLPTRPGIYENYTEVIAEAPAVNIVKVGNDTWKFIGWINPTQTVNNADVKFVGRWEKVYTETYEYENSDQLPAEVKATLPTRAGIYENDTKVTGEAPTVNIVKVGNDTWKFMGWTILTQTVNNADIKFVGRWEKVYTEHYSFSGNLPDDVLKTLPKRHNEYINGNSVIPADPSAKEIAVKGGKWVFVGWDKSSATVDSADVYFVGTWNFVKANAATNTVENKTNNDDGKDTKDTSKKSPAKIVKKVAKHENNVIDTGDDSYSLAIITYILFVSLFTIACLLRRKNNI